MKILDFAIDVEQAEQDLYFRLAKCSSDKTITAIFQMIATKERVLLDKLRKLKKDPNHCRLEISRMPQHEQISKNKHANCELLGQHEIRHDLSSYSYILRTEQLVFNLYAKLRESVSDLESQSLLDLLLTEKRQEISRISTLYDVARVVH